MAAGLVGERVSLFADLGESQRRLLKFVDKVLDGGVGVIVESSLRINSAKLSNLRLRVVFGAKPLPSLWNT